MRSHFGLPARALGRILIGNLRILCEYRTQSRLERTKPRLIRNPLLRATFVQGLANLLRAQSCDQALVFVETQALFLEREIHMTQELPNLSFLVSHHFLVDNAMHLAG